MQIFRVARAQLVAGLGFSNMTTIPYSLARVDDDDREESILEERHANRSYRPTPPSRQVPLSPPCSLRSETSTLRIVVRASTVFLSRRLRSFAAMGNKKRTRQNHQGILLPVKCQRDES
jgi:hypothetical protein